MLAAFDSAIDPVAAGIGAVLGVALALVLGYAIYRGGVRINLSRFFRVTGFVLVLVAGGLLATAVHEFAEASVVTAMQQSVADLSWLVEPGTVHASLLTGMLGVQPVPTAAELLVWLAYVVPMSVYVLWPQRPRQVPARVPA
jgi:high-affinity iron transporter